jgi:hypothetical protein
MKISPIDDGRTKVGAKAGHRETFSTERCVGSLVARESQEYATDSTGSERCDQPVLVVMVFTEGKNLDAKSECGCARDDAFIFPTTYVLCPPTFASAIISN